MAITGISGPVLNRGTWPISSGLLCEWLVSCWLYRLRARVCVCVCVAMVVVLPCYCRLAYKRRLILSLPARLHARGVNTFLSCLVMGVLVKWSAGGDTQTWNWVIGSPGQWAIGSSFTSGSPGHWVIILTRCETRVFPVFEKKSKT